MLLHHVFVQFPDGSVWDTFVETSDAGIEEIANRLAFYKDIGDVSDWRTSRVIREHDFEGFEKSLIKRVEDPPPKKKGKDSDWPYDWPRPDV